MVFFFFYYIIINFKVNSKKDSNSYQFTKIEVILFTVTKKLNEIKNKFKNQQTIRKELRVGRMMFLDKFKKKVTKIQENKF